MVLDIVASLTRLGRPVIEMFWVAEYNNGQALPQFDLFLNRENSYSEVDHKNVLRFWWIPITPEMARQFPGTCYNPLLKRHAVDVNGAKGFVARRTGIEIYVGRRKETSSEKLRRLLSKPPKKIMCYVLGIEGGPRREIYPDGRVKNIAVPGRGESQDLLHHG